MQPNNRKSTKHKLIWRNIECRLTHTRNYMGEGWSHLHLEVMDPAGPPLPITYAASLHHQCDEDDIARAGSENIYLTRLLNQSADCPGYRAALQKWRQLRLF